MVKLKWCVFLTGASKRREFSGMIHKVITFVMSSSQQPPATHPFPAKHHMDLVVTKKVNNGRAERFYGSEKTWKYHESKCLRLFESKHFMGMS